jgi:hypothetical protein
LYIEGIMKNLESRKKRRNENRKRKKREEMD